MAQLNAEQIALAVIEERVPFLRETAARLQDEGYSAKMAAEIALQSMFLQVTSKDVTRAKQVAESR